MGEMVRCGMDKLVLHFFTLIRPHTGANPYGYTGATTFKGVAGALTLLDMGRPILPTSMVLQARVTSSLGC